MNNPEYTYKPPVYNNEHQEVLDLWLSVKDVALALRNAGERISGVLTPATYVIEVPADMLVNLAMLQLSAYEARLANGDGPIMRGYRAAIRFHNLANNSTFATTILEHDLARVAPPITQGGNPKAKICEALTPFFPYVYNGVINWINPMMRSSDVVSMDSHETPTCHVDDFHHEVTATAAGRWRLLLRLPYNHSQGFVSIRGGQGCEPTVANPFIYDALEDDYYQGRLHHVQPDLFVEQLVPFMKEMDWDLDRYLMLCKAKETFFEDRQAAFAAIGPFVDLNLLPEKQRMIHEEDWRQRHDSANPNQLLPYPLYTLMRYDDQYYFEYRDPDGDPFFVMRLKFTEHTTFYVRGKLTNDQLEVTTRNYNHEMGATYRFTDASYHYLLRALVNARRTWFNSVTVWLNRMWSDEEELREQLSPLYESMGITAPSVASE